MLKQQKGMTLVNVMIAAGLLGMIGYGMMRLSSNMGFIQSKSTGHQDSVDLYSLVRMILEDPRYCSISLAAEDPAKEPIRFFKKELDASHPEGFMDVELWLSDQDGLIRTQKKLSASDPTANKHGKLTIDSIQLSFPNNPKTNYLPQKIHYDMGRIDITASYQLNPTKSKTLEKSFFVTVGMTTDNEGQTTLLSCSRPMDAKRLGVEELERNICEDLGYFYLAGEIPRCRHSLGQIHSLPHRGVAFSVVQTSQRCPAGFAAVGLKGSYTQQSITQLHIMCRNITSLRTPGANFHLTSPFGFLGDQTFELSCPSGKWLTGLVGNASQTIHALGPLCSHMTGKAITYPGEVGNRTNQRFSDNCQKNTLIRQIDLTSELNLFGLRATCW